MDNKKTQRLTLITFAVLALAIVGGIIALNFIGGNSSSSTGSRELSLVTQPVYGNPDAKVKVVMFEDFLCSHCANFTEHTLAQLKNEYQGNDDVAFYFINFPLGSFGPDSITAALAGECAFSQDKDAFWDYKTVLMRAQNNTAYNAASLAQIARDTVPSLDADALEQCISDRTYEAEVNSDREMAIGMQVQSTPSTFVNNTSVTATFDSLKIAIDGELQN